MENEKREICAACGDPLTVRFHVGAFVFCRACISGNCTETALQIARSNQQDKLRHIWEKLQEKE